MASPTAFLQPLTKSWRTRAVDSHDSSARSTRVSHRVDDVTPRHVLASRTNSASDAAASPALYEASSRTSCPVHASKITTSTSRAEVMTLTRPADTPGHDTVTSEDVASKWLRTT